MKSEGRVFDPRLPLAEESEHAIRIGPQGGTVTQPIHGQLFLGAYNEHAFHASNTGAAGQTTTVALATTYTGLVLSNPVGSNVLLSVNEVHAAFNIVFTAAAFIGVFVGYHASTDVVHTTPVTAHSDKVGTGGTGKANCDSAATLPIAPHINTVFGEVVASEADSFEHTFSGGVLLPAGAFMGIYTSTASGTNGLLGSIDWEEIRVK
jgi:hypothetical protein